MTIISFLKKFESLIDNYDYYINLAQTNETEFKESLKVINNLVFKKLIKKLKLCIICYLIIIVIISC